MSIERVYYCDGPDCLTHSRTASLSLPAGFFRVDEGEGHEHHFCSWDCILRYAATMPAMEVIPAAGD